ncbi:MAG: NAD(P)H-hydrate dehydratase [Leucobacter sp.]
MNALEHWNASRAAAWVRRPGPQDNKYRRGVLGARTGSAHYPGAAVLSVTAAWRTGVGLLRYVPPLDDVGAPLGLPAPAAAVLAAQPETVFGEPAAGGRACDAWVVGSGTDPATRSTAERARLLEILRGEAPVVIDAGALGIAVERAAGARGLGAGSGSGRTGSESQPVAASSREAAAPGREVSTGSGLAPAILTPHDGEFARLWEAAGGVGTGTRGPLPADDLAERADRAAALAARLGATVLLKGSVSVCATPGGQRIACGPATPWLASAGTGDVLAGILGALVAAHAARVREDPETLGQIGATAALLHDAAARIASGDAHATGSGRPITALDVAEALPAALTDPSDRPVPPRAC